ncbi:amino acid adenylation domain-containing protein [Micromonospora sp. NPDC047187]|uniref:non-ribosomal peptide synthetase n=1 Tax=Micromonospora sp. NPDC047187 TaxID=3155262 RepID=UPI0033C11984
MTGAPGGGPGEAEFPVSPGQLRLLVLEQLQPGSAQYHVPIAFAVDGSFDPAAFGRALTAVIRRHEALRTSFPVRNGRFVQAVAAEPTVDVRVTDGWSPAEVPAVMADAAREPFDLADGPLLRCRIYGLTDGSHRLLLVVHHLVCDGWSVAILLQDLATAYAGGGLEPPPLQYPDVAVWQHDLLSSGGYGEAIADWRAELAGVPDVLALPADRTRPQIQSAAGDSVAVPLGDDVAERVRAVAARTGSTDFAVLLATFGVFLGRVSGATDLLVGVPVAGRDHPDLQDVVGLLTNTVAVRVDLSGDPSFVAMVRRVRDRLAWSRARQAAPWTEVVAALAPERRLSHDPVVQAMFSYDDAAGELALPDARVRRVDAGVTAAKSDLLGYLENTRDGLSLRLIYRTDLFEPSTMRHWARAFATLIDGLLAAPDQPVETAELLDDESRRMMLRDWNHTDEVVPNARVPELIAQRATAHPERTALVADGHVVSYRDLVSRADRIADRLRAAGTGPGSVVALLLPRGAEFGVAALGVLRAGCAYLPVDPWQPAQRIRFILADAGAEVVIARADTAVEAAACDLPVLLLDAAARTAGEVSRATAHRGRRPDSDLAYLIYTSGSTGQPKGVRVGHPALTNLATAVARRLGLDAEDRVLQFVSVTFDVAVADYFMTWVAGAELHVAADCERLGRPLLARLRDARITWCFLPPSAGMSLPYDEEALPALRAFAFCGEQCPAELVARWSRPGRRIINAYGPTEAAVFTTSADLTVDRPVVIGRPLPNHRAYLLDGRLRPVPVGVPGELYLAGRGLADGYAVRARETAARFVPDPFGPPGSRMYRTGDLARYDSAGMLTYLGRTDHQVKLHGFRIELEEVESVLSGHPQVARAAVAVRGDGQHRRLAAYVVAAGVAPGPESLRTWLADRLPEYMVPEVFVPLPDLPQGQTGKVDRSRLPAVEAVRPALTHAYVAAVTPMQRRLAEVWAAALEVDRVGVNDNFFDLGGNSIRALAVVERLRSWPESQITLMDLFRHTTVAALARRMEIGPASVDLGDARRRGERRALVLGSARGAAKDRTSDRRIP